MPARIRTHAAVLLGYVCVAAIFSWPLPVRLDDAFLGGVSGDTGVYVWNLWVFRHEIVSNGNFPFLTREVLPLTPAVPLTLHNYTTAANIVAWFLLPLVGIVRTFNLLTLASLVLAAYTMFLLARRRTGSDGAAWVAGLAFGFSPFMNARAEAHFSLIQAAPLPAFVLCFQALMERPTKRIAAAAGATVAWAFLSDPYYAVYCVLIAGFMLAVAALQVDVTRASLRRMPGHAAIDLLLIVLAGVIAGILVRGGGSVEVAGIRISLTHLYNPVLAFTVLLLARVALSVRPRISLAPVLPPLRTLVTLAGVCALLVAPVLGAMGSRITARNNWISPPVFWRSSAPGIDALSFFLPNPLHPLFRGRFVEGLSASPGGLVENVASIPWTLLAIITAGTLLAGTRPPRRWVGWTVFFASLALGPFINVAGVLTYIPTPWAVIRYVPVIGAARMPPRFTVLVMLGVAMLAAYAVRDLCARSRRHRLLIATVTLMLLAEALPAPRAVHSARVPAIYDIIAADPRDVRVLNLPFGLRDGLSSYGNTTAAWQYYQTVHEKPILGGYLSRLPAADVEFYQTGLVTRVLMELSAGDAVAPARLNDAITRAQESREELNIGYVVVNVPRSSEALIEFARCSFALEYVATDGDYVLYRAASRQGSS